MYCFASQISSVKNPKKLAQIGGCAKSSKSYSGRFKSLKLIITYQILLKYLYISIWYSQNVALKVLAQF